MSHTTDYNERLNQLRARKQAKRDLIARVIDEFGPQGAFELLLDAATDIEDLLASSAPKAPRVDTRAASVAAAPEPSAPAGKTRGRKGKKRAGAAAAKAAAPAPEPRGKAARRGVKGVRVAVSALVLEALASEGNRKLMSPEIISAVRSNRPDVGEGKIHEALTRLVKKADSPLIRKGRPGKYRYALRSDKGEQAAPEASSSSEKSPTNSAERILDALRAGPTIDYGQLAQSVFGAVNAATRQRIRNGLHSLKRSGKVRRRDDASWEVID